MKSKRKIHTWKTVWLYFSNKQNDLLAEVRIMQYSKSSGWTLFPVKWSMKRGNLRVHSRQWECTYTQAIAQLPANRSQSALWTFRAAFKEKSSTVWTKWLATSFLLFHRSQTFSQDWGQQVGNTVFRDVCLLTYFPQCPECPGESRLFQTTEMKTWLDPFNKIFQKDSIKKTCTPIVRAVF